ncbi:hypothetical protein Drorol1_Dr00004753 [Drosera rotundifolia]
MPSETAAETRRPSTTPTTKPNHMGAQPTAADQEPLPCPRCDSTNTKFCYYNNYNFSQPRHFCKSCRRYWTQGGTLRDVPVGGGTRRSAKRPRSTFVSHPPVISSTVSSASVDPIASTPLFMSLSAAGGAGGAYMEDLMVKPVGVGGFSSLINGVGPTGFLALGGFELGLGIGSGLDEVGFGLGRGVWALPEVGYLGGGSGLGGDNGGDVRGDTWQMDGGGASGLRGWW